LTRDSIVVVSEGISVRRAIK